MPKNNVLPRGEFFTTIPDYFLTHVMTELSASELRVMLYILLHTLGYGKLADAISYDQFLNGIVSREGCQLDKGAGVSRRSLIGALTSLEKRGLITRSHQTLRAATITLKLENGISNPGKALTSDSCAKKRLFSPQKEDSTSKVALKAENQKGPDEASYPACQLPGANPLPQTAAQSLPFSGLAAGQNLPFKEEKEGQILPSTWRDRNTNHEDINRVQSTAVPANIVKTVVEEIDGITEKDAKRLVAIALNTHGRDQTYIEQLVKYVTTNPRIENQAACLTSLIKTDRDRTLPGEASLEKRPPKKRAGKSAFWTASDKNIISHPDGTLPFDPPYPGDTAFSELLVSKHLVNDYSKAAYLVRLARDYNVASATLRKLVWQAEGTGVGQRSQSFEKLLNEAIKEAAAVSTNVSRVTLRRPIDFKKYQPGGKYGFLTS